MVLEISSTAPVKMFQRLSAAVKTLLQCSISVEFESVSLKNHREEITTNLEGHCIINAGSQFLLTCPTYLLSTSQSCVTVMGTVLVPQERPECYSYSSIDLTLSSALMS